MIAQWTFETAPPADLNNSTTITGIAADFGSGTASGVHASAATDWTTPAGNGSANSLSVNTWTVGDYFQFQTSTTGFDDITVSWDQTGSATGPAEFTLSYSTDGTNFTNFANYSTIANAAPPGFWNATTAFTEYTQSFNLSAIASLEDATDVFFRLVNRSTLSLNGGTVAAGGTGRVDNFTVNGLAVAGVPEPGSILLTSVAFGGMALVRRRRMKATS
ncbi:MAG TPA: PEP-CTERM sorting domain-containing protein [Caulifigura sp.]|nr:PEP-CTERM sorting domain-containing protein [Caulifigura sp.]